MRSDLFLKILASFPVILIALYFIPFLGICLIILRYFMYADKKITTPAILIGLGVILLLPRGIDAIATIIGLDVSFIPYIDTILSANLYNTNFINYSKILITTGVILLIIGAVTRSLFDKFTNKIKSYIFSQEQKNAQILAKNDLIMEEKREKARNTSFVICSYCGADNVVTGKTTRCKYCRRTIVNKNYKA